MPVKDGLAALQEILGIDPGARVVMLTSESEQDMVIKAVQNGARNYVVKPPERATLLAKIKAALAPRN
jgi:two-component system chemotaxis response regulator CheY